MTVLFPYTHKPWSRKESQPGFGAQQGRLYLPPRDDINSPDSKYRDCKVNTRGLTLAVYIPVMGLITYVIVCTLLAGLKGAFDPALLGSILTWASLIIFLEIGIIRGAIYFLDITNESSLKDLLAYSGYKCKLLLPDYSVHHPLTINLSRRNKRQHDPGRDLEPWRRHWRLVRQRRIPLHLPRQRLLPRTYPANSTIVP